MSNEIHDKCRRKSKVLWKQKRRSLNVQRNRGMMGILLRSNFYAFFFFFDESNEKREKGIELEKKQKKHGTVPETDAGG